MMMYITSIYIHWYTVCKRYVPACLPYAPPPVSCLHAVRAALLDQLESAPGEVGGGVSPARKARKSKLVAYGDMQHRSVIQAGIEIDQREKEMVSHARLTHASCCPIHVSCCLTHA